MILICSKRVALSTWSLFFDFTFKVTLLAFFRALMLFCKLVSKKAKNKSKFYFSKSQVPLHVLFKVSEIFL